MADAVSPRSNRPTGRRGDGWSRYLFYFAIAAGVAWLLSRQSSGPSEDTPAKEFNLPSVVQPGKSFCLQEQLGTPVLIEVFASWCSVCKRMAPVLSDVASAQRTGPVRFVGVSVDDSEASARAAAQAWRIPYDVVLDDGSFSRDYKIEVLPTFILVDQAGKVRHVAAGGVRGRTLEGWLEEVGAGVR